MAGPSEPDNDDTSDGDASGPWPVALDDETLWIEPSDDLAARIAAAIARAEADS